MPLPTNPLLAWPPKQVAADILPAMARWSAWWSNDLARLQAAYGGGMAIDPNSTGGFFASDAGGVKVHSLGPFRWFVGQAQLGTAQNTKVPIPIAAEICQASADLLFSEPVTITVGKPVKLTDADGNEVEQPNPTQARLQDLLDENFDAKLSEAAEAAAALGGVYLRATFDTANHPEGPFSTIVDADMSVPEFDLAGCLTAVTFWTVIARDGKTVWRHLERHELAGTRRYGVILHGLYQGEDDVLGMRVALTARDETAGLAVHVDLNVEGSINTASEGLAVEYIPNQTPNRMWRHDPLGRNLGRSDLDGIEHLMDQLAETMTDWMRARRAARARVLTAKDLVKSSGPGNVSTVNLDQETYVETSLPRGAGASAQKMSDLVDVMQPAFDPAGYAATAEALIIRILEMSGYSSQTFGVQPEGAADRTATEIESKERRSLMTRGRKIRPWTVGLRNHIRKLLAIDNSFFQQHNDVTDIEIEFADGVQESQIKLGQFVQSLFNAQSASIEERVSILHGDWTEAQINAEADKIREEFATAPLMDPTFPSFGDAGNLDGQSGVPAPVGD